MKLALIGFRGIPVIYSGFESFAEKLSTELAKRDYRVTVYCRSPYVDRKRKWYKKVQLITLQTIKTKNLETLIHSFIATIHACFFRRYDVIYYLGVGNAIFCLLPRFLGVKTVINVDGLDWKREKWGRIARIYLNISAYLSTILPDKAITDSLFMKGHYTKTYKKELYYIPYGYFEEVSSQSNPSILEKYRLKKRNYLVWVGRLVPENHVEELLSAFRELKTEFKCVIIGDDLYKVNSYKQMIFKLTKKDSRIILTGFLRRREYVEIVKNSFAYIETKRSGGSHPSLIEAMGFGCLIISNNHPANKEVLGKYAVFYDPKFPEDDLKKKIEEYLQDKRKQETLYLRSLVKSRTKRFFDWRKIVDRYDELFKKLCA